MAVHSLLVAISIVLCSFASAFYLRMDDYLEDIGAEVEINPVEVEYYDSSAAMPPMVKRKKLGKTKLISNNEKNALHQAHGISYYIYMPCSMLLPLVVWYNMF